MALIKEGRITRDIWRDARADAVPSGEAPVIIGREQWLAQRDRLAGRNAPLALWLASEETLDGLAGEFSNFAMIALEFPKFTDGRAYSTARLLRGRHRYSGELRAVGAVQRDQFQFMARCGFDAFEIDGEDAAVLEDWCHASAEIGLFYQPAADGAATIAALRQQRVAPARATG